MISPRHPNLRWRTLGLLACTAVLAIAGCRNAPGKPGPEPEVVRPSQILDFATLYNQNCASCHGEHGQNGAAISLANPVYIAIAGTQNIQRITAAGVPNTAMPPFARSAGGMLTDQQISILAQGIEQSWSRPSALAGQTPPAYAASATGDPGRGQQAFTTSCAQCHGAEGTGGKSNGVLIGSLVDPSYLALITNQGLRSIIIAGQPEQGMPDWRSHPGAAVPLTDQQVTDIVAWLVSHRIATPGQPYKQHP